MREDDDKDFPKNLYIKTRSRGRGSHNVSKTRTGDGVVKYIRADTVTRSHLQLTSHYNSQQQALVTATIKAVQEKLNVYANGVIGRLIPTSMLGQVLSEISEDEILRKVRG